MIEVEHGHKVVKYTCAGKYSTSLESVQYLHKHTLVLLFRTRYSVLYTLLVIFYYFN